MKLEIYGVLAGLLVFCCFGYFSAADEVREPAPTNSDTNPLVAIREVGDLDVIGDPAPIDIDAIDRVVRGEIVRIEGEILKIGDKFYLKDFPPGGRSYELRFGSGKFETRASAYYAVEGKIRINANRSGIEYVEVDKYQEIVFANRDLIKSLMWLTISLREKIELDKFNCDVSSVRDLVVAQFMYFSKKYPKLFEMAKKERRERELNREK